MEILLLEKELQLAAVLRGALAGAGHHVETAGSLGSALRAVKRARFDLLLAGKRLSTASSLKILQGARLPNSPVVLRMPAELGHQGSVSPGTGGEAIADPSESAIDDLLARIDLVHRPGSGCGATALRFQVGDLVMDVALRRVERSGEVIELSRREFDVLELFMREPGRTFTRDDLCKEVWGQDHIYETRTVEIVIMRLRKKIDADNEPSLIGTVRGVGYVMLPVG